MDIKSFRKTVQMTQRQFADYFGIPLGTIRNWEQGISTPPEYVWGMIFNIIRRDKMINVETIKFYKMLDELAKLTNSGFDDFANADQDTKHSKVFYDKENPNDEGFYPIVLDSCVDDYHHDAISYYDSSSEEYNIHVVLEEDEDPYILVTLLLSQEQIVIEDGKWYFV